MFEMDRQGAILLEMTFLSLSFSLTNKSLFFVLFVSFLLFADMQFRFLSQQGAMDTVSSLSVNLLQYPPKRYISGPFQFFADEAPMDLVQECLQKALVPENMLQVVGAPEYHQEEENENATKNQKDAWYGTEYRVVDFEKSMFECWKNPFERRQSPNKDDEEFEKHEDLMQKLMQALHLPEPNDMLPSNFDLKQADPKYFGSKESTPRCLMDNGETLRLWYKPDTAFGMPKVNIMILLRSSLAYTASPMHAVLASMWSEVRVCVAVARKRRILSKTLDVCRRFVAHIVYIVLSSGHSRNLQRRIHLSSVRGRVAL
jgi:secreted Zn-dependent insulinase-like peptidase